MCEIVNFSKVKGLQLATLVAINISQVFFKDFA